MIDRNKMKMITYLLEDSVKESVKHEEYEMDRARAIKVSEDKEEDGHGWWSYMDRNIIDGKKTRVKENLKMVRRICLEMTKELDANNRLF